MVGPAVGRGAGIDGAIGAGHGGLASSVVAVGGDQSRRLRGAGGGVAEAVDEVGHTELVVFSLVVVGIVGHIALVAGRGIKGGH